MENYHYMSELGSGTYGRVFKAVGLATGEVVAVKQLYQKYRSWADCTELPEVQSLLKLQNHPNVIKVKHFIFEKDEFFLVFEYMNHNLAQLIMHRPFSEAQVRRWMFQTLDALRFMHRVRYFHRDLKPANLLVSADGVIKVADFGMATKLVPGGAYESKVTTLWYRAPEVLLQDGSHSARYGPAVDVWAAGAIMAELLTRRPLFPGRDEVDQLYHICDVLGAPTERTWLDGMRMADRLEFEFPCVDAPTLRSTLRNVASAEAVDLICRMCSWDPEKEAHGVTGIATSLLQAGSQGVMCTKCGYLMSTRWFPVRGFGARWNHGADDRIFGGEWKVWIRSHWIQSFCSGSTTGSSLIDNQMWPWPTQC